MTREKKTDTCIHKNIEGWVTPAQFPQFTIGAFKQTNKKINKNKSEIEEVQVRNYQIMKRTNEQINK